MTEFTRPIVTVDVVPLTIHQDQLKVLVAPRTKEPFANRLALIGGYVHTDKDKVAGDAARRVLRDKVGITQLYVEQLSTFSGNDRDPRGWSISIAYFSLTPYERVENAVDRGAAQMIPVDQAKGMPFDHDQILNAAVDRLRGKGAYSDLPARLIDGEFTMTELHRAYQIALGEMLNWDAFRRKILERGFIEEAEGKRRIEGSTKPGQLYRLKPGIAVFDRRV